MIRKFILVILSTFFLALRGWGQGKTPDKVLNHLFTRNVKTLSELIRRFNGIESHPDIKGDSMSRANNIYALVSQDIDHRGLSDEEYMRFVYTFADDVIKWGGELNGTTGNMWAETKCDFKLNGKPLRLTIILKQETKPNGDIRWCIAGVKGLQEGGVYDDKTYSISPVDHEINFITFDDYFNHNRKISAGLRSSTHAIDELSMFLGLLHCEQFKFINTAETKFHFLDIPGYIISVASSKRSSDMGGWAISTIEPAGEFDKLDFLNKLFGL